MIELVMDGEATMALSNRQAVEDWVRAAADLAGMHIIGTQSHVLPSGHDSGPGVTAFAVIAESHIAVHTWPETGMVRANIFSCYDFDVEAQVGLFTNMFGVTHLRTCQTVKRA